MSFVWKEYLVRNLMKWILANAYPTTYLRTLKPTNSRESPIRDKEQRVLGDLPRLPVSHIYIHPWKVGRKRHCCCITLDPEPELYFPAFCCLYLFLVMVGLAQSIPPSHLENKVPGLAYDIHAG